VAQKLPNGEARRGMLSRGDVNRVHVDVTCSI
jgi:hypothetical protein